MTYYELKKILPTKRVVVVLAVLIVLLSVVLGAIIRENYCLDENGEEYTGFAAIAKIRADKKAWAGELTEEQLQRIIENHIRIMQTPEAQSDDYHQNNIAFGWVSGFVISLMLFRGVLKDCRALGQSSINIATTGNESIYFHTGLIHVCRIVLYISLSPA